ncbi:hypothetical protein ACQY0O_005284 [Thecaphora frezii]
MEAMRRRIMEQQMAVIEKAREEHRQGQGVQPAVAGSKPKPFNSEITSIPKRNKHAASPKVKLYQPALNQPPPSVSSSAPSASTQAPSSYSSQAAAPSASARVPQPAKTPTKVIPGHSPFYSMPVPSPALGPFANSIPAHLTASPSKPAAMLQGDPLDEPEPSHYGGATVTAADREKQLQDMITHMVSVIDVDISKAKINGMKCTLLPHQIQGVQWMKDIESGKYKGGILADDMGLGKTVQMLALIVSNRPDQEAVKKSVARTKFAPPKKGIPAQAKGKATLIIAPLAVIRQWEREVIEKTEVGLKVYVHHGPKRTKTAAELSKHDVVVTTYTTVSSEHANFLASRDESVKGALGLRYSDEDEDSETNGGSASDSDSEVEGSPRKKAVSKKKPKAPARKPKASPAPLFEMDWLRVVLDEAQTVKNRNAKVSKACFGLSGRAQYRWCLTGTPIQNDCYELFSLIHFLRIGPFDDYKHFKLKIGDPVMSNNQNRVNWGMKRLVAVLRMIMLRRTKDATYEGKPILQLPDRIVEVVSSDFDDPEERKFYAELESTIRKNKSEADKREQKSNLVADLVMLLRMRQACSHPTLTLSKATDMEAVSAPSVPDPTSKAAGAGGKVSDDDDDDDLAAMFSSLTVAKKVCERCQAPLPQPPADSVSSMHKTLCEGCITAVQKIKGANWTAEKGSTKIRMMLKILDEIRSGDRSEKTIVFSQFTSFLDLVEPFLRMHKYNFVRFDGSMRQDERERNLETIRSDPSTTVILISFKAGATGLNLTCCSRVILMDLWWNPQIEEQAFDRAHRLGQKRTVKIYKLSITDTVEQRILSLQEKKRNLAKAALEGTKLVKGNRLDRTELMYLFNGGPRDGRSGA